MVPASRQQSKGGRHPTDSTEAIPALLRRRCMNSRKDTTRKDAVLCVQHYAGTEPTLPHACSALAAHLLLSSLSDSASKKGINLVSFSTTVNLCTPASRMDRVSVPGPGPTSITCARLKSPATRTNLSVLERMGEGCSDILGLGAAKKCVRGAYSTCCVIRNDDHSHQAMNTACESLQGSIDPGTATANGSFLSRVCSPATLRSNRKFCDSCFLADTLNKRISSGTDNARWAII